MGTTEHTSHLREQLCAGIDPIPRSQEWRGTSFVLRALLSSVPPMAPAESAVLPTGKTNSRNAPTGRILHRPPDPASQVSASVNCAALCSRLDSYSFLLDSVSSRNPEDPLFGSNQHHNSNASLAEKVKEMHSHDRPKDPDNSSPSKIELISHALDNLLCVINSNADILADQLDPGHGAHRHISRIKKAIKTAGDLVCQLRIA